MPRLLVRLAFITALALLGAGTAGFARASIVALGDLGNPFAPSAVPSLLGPINELGRNGWDCVPERAAQAARAKAARLPAAGTVAADQQ